MPSTFPHLPLLWCLSAVLCVLGATSLAAEEPEAGGLGPGRHRQLPAGEWTWDVHIPPAYATETERRFPVLYLSSPVTNPGTMDLHRWADEQGVIIVGFNESENGLPMTQIVAIQDAVMAEVERRLRVHPHLNFAAGISGGANCSLALVDRKPQRFAGVLMQCMSGVPEARHIGVCWIHGAKDDTIGVGGVWSGYDRCRSAGRPCWIEVNRGRKHTPGSRDEKEHAMSFLLWTGKLTHPGLPDDEKRAFYQDFDRAMTACAAMTDPQALIERAEFLASLPNAAKAPAYPAMVAAWSRMRWQQIEAAADAGEKLEGLLRLGRHELAGGMDGEVRRQSAALMKTLRKDAQAVAHCDAVFRFDRWFVAEKRAGLDRSALAEVRAGFQALADEYPDHPIGRSAAGNAERLGRH